MGRLRGKTRLTESLPEPRCRVHTLTSIIGKVSLTETNSKSIPDEVDIFNSWRGWELGMSGLFFSFPFSSFLLPSFFRAGK